MVSFQCKFLSVQSSAVGTVVSSRWVALTFKIVKAVWTQYSPLPKHSPEASREEASLQPERILIPAVRGCEDIFPGGKKERVVGDRAIWTFYTLKKFWCIFSVVLRKHEIRYSVQFSRSVVSDFLWPHGLQHAWPPRPSPTPGVHSNSWSLSTACGALTRLRMRL